MTAPVLLVMASGTSTISPATRARPRRRVSVALVLVSPSVSVVEAPARSAMLVASSSLTATSASPLVVDTVYSPLSAAARARLSEPSTSSVLSASVAMVRVALVVFFGMVTVAVSVRVWAATKLPCWVSVTLTVRSTGMEALLVSVQTASLPSVMFLPLLSTDTLISGMTLSSVRVMVAGLTVRPWTAGVSAPVTEIVSSASLTPS